MTSRRRATLMLRYACAAGAIVTAGYAAPAAAQGYQGDPTIIRGGVTITRTPGHDQIVVDSPIAVIDWSSFNPSPIGPLDFLPAGNSVNYLGTVANYTVLNRIRPNATVPIMLNGAITSQFAAAAKPVTGGSIWFYTPGGFMIGSTATFNVGGLLLSANNIPLDANNGFDPNVARFVGTVGSTSGISIAAGAQIDALDYVALIAPKIAQAGAIRSDGQIAYIAAETGTLTMPLGGGLFSIAIDAGGGTTVGGTAIDHSGTTGGPVVGGAGPRRIYMVTVAKNNAVTMLLGGSIGATGAANVGDAVVLSAGRDVVSGNAVLTGAAAGPAASIQITNAKISSPLTASASGDLTLLAQGGGTLSLSGDTLAVADGTATLRAGTGSLITTSGNLTLQSARFGLTAGTAQVIADNGGVIAIKGQLDVLADGDGVRRGFKGGGSAAGGVASVSANGGTITSTGLTVSATAVAQPTGAAVTSQGGAASVQLSNGASLNTGPLTMNASGDVGGTSAGTGGAVSVAVNGAQLVAGTTSLFADGNATGAGGTVSLTAGNSGAGGTINLGDTRISASGALGGRITLTNASSAATPAIRLASLNASALGTPAIGAPSFALTAQGNRVAITGNAVITTGGSQSYIATGAGGLDVGGTTRLVSGGTIDFTGAFDLSSTGALGLRAAGSVTGAAATIRGAGNVALTTGGNLNLASLSVGGVFTGADATGAAAALPGVAGSATLGTLTVNGGDIDLTAPGGITIGQVFVSEGRLVRLDAQGAALRVTNITGGPLGVAGAITLNGGSITADRLQARGAATLTSTGAVLVSTDVAAGSVAATGSSVTLSALGPLAITSIIATAGDAIARSGGDLSVAGGQASGAMTFTATGNTTLNGAFIAGTALNVTGQGIAVNGTLRAPQIGLRSTTIQIGGAAQIGFAGVTQGVTFTNTGAGASFIGGAGGAGYSLTNAGLGRVQSRDIAIVLPADATVGALTLNGAATPGGTPVNLGGTLSIATLGTITVNGAVRVNTATAANALTLNAGPAIRVVTPTGSIAIVDGAVAATGTLTLNAGTIAVASQATLTGIAGAGSIAERNARLGVNDGPVNDQGYLVAGTMRFSVGTGLYIQNSGVFSTQLTDRRGFTVGDGGLTISTLGSGPVEIVINGRQLGASGIAITGVALIPKIALNNGLGGAALFDPDSTVNGCRILAKTCPPVGLTPKTIVGIRDTIDLVNGGSSNGLPPAIKEGGLTGVIPPIILPAIAIDGTDPFSAEPPIDEPVIGVGNEDGWSDGKKP